MPTTFKTRSGDPADPAEVSEHQAATLERLNALLLLPALLLLSPSPSVSLQGRQKITIVRVQRQRRGNLRAHAFTVGEISAGERRLRSLWATPVTAPNGHRSNRPMGYWPNGRDFRPMVDDAGHGPNGHFGLREKTEGPQMGQTWATGGPQSKPPTLRSALNYSKLLFLFGNFGCEGRI